MIEQTFQAFLGNRLLNRVKPFWWILPLSLLPIGYFIIQSRLSEPIPPAALPLKQTNQAPPVVTPPQQQISPIPSPATQKPRATAPQKQSPPKDDLHSQQQIQRQTRQVQRKAKALVPSKDSLSPQLRVAIATGADSLQVGASKPAVVFTDQGQVLGQLQSAQALQAQADGQLVRLGSWQAPSVLWVQPTSGGYVSIGDRWYRGAVRLILQGNHLLAVNYVDLEHYLYSVVGGEVSPSWPSDALKAQAIAARSYALVHHFRPAGSFYDLGATTRWQVYRGVQDEWNTTHQAVNATRGFVLGYKGGVVESMYAASDSIITKIFKGVGMSQTGAYKLATQGYDYLHILGTYYPGTSLARIQVSR